MSNITRIPPLQFAHVLDTNKNIVRLVVGPHTLVLQTNEDLTVGPLPMITIPPGFYCVINDPVKEYVEGEKCTLQLGHTKVRFHGEPFPLYPGESLESATNFGHGSTDYKAAIKPLPVVNANSAIILTAVLDHDDDDGVARVAGDRWQLEGPLTYKPRPEVKMEEIITSTIIKSGQVLRLKAIQDTVDRLGIPRVTGEEWLVKKPGAYLPGVFETVLALLNVHTLTSDTGLHLRATQNLTDLSGKKRQTGEEWLLTSDLSTEYSTQVGVEIVKHVKKIVVKKGEYAVVLDPVDKNGKQQLGQKVLKVGLCSFFMHPGESLENSTIQKAHVLSEEESMVLQALIAFMDTVDGKPVKRKTGDVWLIKGPLMYIPPVEVKIIKQRKRIPLSKNEGIYVQDTHSGKVRLVMGPCAYMLTATEELWEKELSNETEQLLRLLYSKYKTSEKCLVIKKYW